MNIEEGEKLLRRAEASQKKREAKATHEAALLEFMCAETRLSTWLRANVAELLVAARSAEALGRQAACSHGGWKVCRECGWAPG